jgi:hypothetical protein
MKFLIILLVLTLIPLIRCGFEDSEEEMVKRREIEENHIAVEKVSGTWKGVEIKVFMLFGFIISLLAISSTVVLVWNLAKIGDVGAHSANHTIV